MVRAGSRSGAPFATGHCWRRKGFGQPCTRPARPVCGVVLSTRGPRSRLTSGWLPWSSRSARGIGAPPRSAKGEPPELRHGPASVEVARTTSPVEPPLDARPNPTLEISARTMSAEQQQQQRRSNSSSRMNAPHLAAPRTHKQPSPSRSNHRRVRPGRSLHQRRQGRHAGS